MADLISMLAAAAGAGGAAPTTDPNFNQTVLLLHGDGTNGAQNNTFLDSSTNNFTITRNGNTTQGTFSPFSLPNGQWSNYFDGDDYLTASGSATVSGTGAFTVEFWMYMTATQTYGRLVSGAADNITINISSNGDFDYGKNGVNSIISGNAGSLLNQWVHVCVARSSGNTARVWINGTSLGTATDNNNYTGGTVYIGASSTPSSYFTGYLSNLRITNTDVYGTGNTSITVPTAPLTAILGTSFLASQSNRFVDNSTNNFAITVNGNPSVQPFSPFLPTAEYDASVNGGSGYFDGSGDYLSVPSNTAFAFGTGDFTVEGWVYYSSVATNAMRILATAGVTADVVVEINTSSQLQFFGGGLVTFSGATTQANAWNHIAVTRSGTSLRGYINGAQVDTTKTNSANIVSTQAVNFPATTNYAATSGYISSVRYLKGTALYTGSSYTVPTAPLTAITNTSFLCNFTNAGIFDNTGKNNLETVGDAQIDTTTKKYGTGSIEFDGNGDWLLIPNNPDIQLGTGNFTIEFWVYLASGDTGSARGLVAKGGASTGWLVSLDSSQKVVFTYTTSTITSSGAITTNAWNHIAVVRSGTGSNQTKIYISGTNDGTGTVSTDFNQTEVMYIGANRAAGDPMKGFIDDLRITKGIARYTANFTPPTAAFPNL